jgi:hypothetical protein
MKNRIASLFALDTLLGGTTNGHGPATHPPEHRKRGKVPKAARRGPKGKEMPRSGKSVDKGDPIRCQHDVAYKPVAPVDVGKSTTSTPSTAPVAQQLGDEYDVEAFEEPDEEDMTPRLGDEDEYDRLETASGMPWEEEPPETPEGEPEPVTVRSESYRKPATFAAEMTAVEQDLADLAARAAQPAPVGPTPASPAPDDSAPEPAPPPAPKPSGHAVFDQMAQGMGYATEFRLPPVPLTQVFSALDRQLDAEAIKPATSTPVAGSPAPADAVAAVPPTETLIKDLVAMPPQPTAPETAPVSPG